MCLTCAKVGVHGKKALKNLFVFKTKDKREIYFRANLMCPDNKVIELKQYQIDEIINNAVVVVPTSVDLAIDIWAIQWPRGYKVKTINIAA